MENEQPSHKRRGIGVKISFSAIASKYYRAQEDKKVTNVTPDKPLRKHTKPEVKKQLKDIATKITSGQISDDDIKIMDQAIAKAIKTGKAPKRVGVSTAALIGKKPKKKGGFKSKEIDNFKRLNGHFIIAIDGLTLWADGQMKPETRDKAETPCYCK